MAKIEKDWSGTGYPETGLSKAEQVAEKVPKVLGIESRSCLGYQLPEILLRRNQSSLQWKQKVPAVASLEDPKSE